MARKHARATTLKRVAAVPRISALRPYSRRASRPPIQREAATTCTLSGLTTLAAANLLWFVLLVLGGVLFPLSAFGPAEPLLSLLPTAALSTGLRDVLQDGLVPVREMAVLAGWALVSLTAASRAFRWE